MKGTIDKELIKNFLKFLQNESIVSSHQFFSNFSASA